MSRKLSRAVCLVGLLAVLTACGEDAGYRYSNYHCNLTLDNGTHQDATLATAMNPMAKGVFCKIGYLLRGGASHYTFENNQGMSSVGIFNAIDLRLENQNRIGMNHGLIVGYGSMDDPPIFYAYDAECPNCFDLNALPMRSYPLTVTGDGVASCGRCKAAYNLNTGGNLVRGSGVPLLTSYRCNAPTPYGVLKVY